MLCYPHRHHNTRTTRAIHLNGESTQTFATRVRNTIMPPALPGFDAVRPREETTMGTSVVADASGEEDEAPQHFGTVEVSPPPGGKKPKCRKNNAPGISNVVLSARLIGGVGRRKPLNHHCRPAAPRNEIRSLRSDDSERVDMEPSQNFATTVSKDAAVHGKLP